MRSYKCLVHQVFIAGNYKLIPIRDEDRFQIMQWRNEQIEILRQKNPLTPEKQDEYFKEVVSKLFEEANPSQLLFSFLEDDNLIGYGGLVHIDWVSGNAEVSFITETSRNQDSFVSDWCIYLSLIKQVGSVAKFIKIYTYAYDLRPLLYLALKQSSFKEEARLKKHVLINERYVDVLIHSFFFLEISIRKATIDDLMMYFHWANDEQVRSNSFNTHEIVLSDHEKWFLKKLNSRDTILFVALVNHQPVGQIRFDGLPNKSYEIGFSIDKDFRGLGLGSEIIRTGTSELLRLNSDTTQIIGKVKVENMSSSRSFQKAGYSLMTDKDTDHETYFFRNK